LETRIVFVVEDGGFVKYERLGECLACGDCCRKFNYSFQRTTVSIMAPGDEVDEEKDIGKWEDWAVENWDNKDEWTWWGPFEIISLDEPKCRCFDPLTNHCSEFGQDDWREICRKFPFRQADLEGLDNCAFSFRRIE